jgi:hypothetical protein
MHQNALEQFNSQDSNSKDYYKLSNKRLEKNCNSFLAVNDATQIIGFREDEGDDDVNQDVTK